MKSTDIVVSRRGEDRISDTRFEAALGDLWGRLESAESRRGYQDDWRRYCTWLAISGLDPRTVDAATVQQYVNALRDAKKSKATRARALSVIREVYRALVVGGIVASNPAREVKNPKVDKLPNTPYLNESEIRAFMDYAYVGEDWFARRNRCLVLCLALLGIRRAEVARLCVEDFSGDTVELLLKRGKERTVRVPEYLLGEIAAWRAYAAIDAGPIFPRSPQDVRPVSPKIVYDVVSGIAAEAGVKHVSPHAFRRSFITLGERRGAALRDLQVAVSHESITTTEGYVKAVEGAKLAPGEVLVDLVRNQAVVK